MVFLFEKRLKGKSLQRKCSLHRQGDLNSDPQHLCKKAIWDSLSLAPVLRESAMGAAYPCSLANRPSQMSSRFIER